jgi:hypothetical protein
MHLRFLAASCVVVALSAPSWAAPPRPAADDAQGMAWRGMLYVTGTNFSETPVLYVFGLPGEAE